MADKWCLPGMIFGYLGRLLFGAGSPPFPGSGEGVNSNLDDGPTGLKSALRKTDTTLDSDIIKDNAYLSLLNNQSRALRSIIENYPTGFMTEIVQNIGIDSVLNADNQYVYSALNIEDAGLIAYIYQSVGVNSLLSAQQVGLRSM